MLLLALGYGAGLATGLAHLTAPPFVVAVLVLLAIVSWREAWFPVVPALAVGALVGNAARRDAAEWCGARLPLGDTQLEVQALDPAEGTGRVIVRNAGCHHPVMARWPRDIRWPAGYRFAVTARWVPLARPLGRPDGMLRIRNAFAVDSSTTTVERIRTEIADATHRLYGARAPLANALIAGWRGELDPELREAFAGAGLMHLLAISGLHVAWLAGWVLIALRLARVPRHPAEWLAACGALCYAGFLGWPSAALRAALLLLLAAFCRWRQRHVRFGALLGASVSLLLLFDPWAIADPGLWLSIAGLTGVVAGVRWSEHAIGKAWWIQSLGGSCGAVIATAPIAAAVFGQVAPVGIVLNMAGLPLLIAALPALFASVTIFPVSSGFAAGIAASGNALLALLEQLARIGAEIPGSAGAGATGWRAAMPWIALLVATVWITWGNSTIAEAVRRTAWCGMTAALFTLVMQSANASGDGDRQLTILFLDVGQGDGALIRTPLNHWIAVDAGPLGDHQDAGRSTVIPALARRGVKRLDLFVLSHAHRDHVGGAASLVGALPVDIALEPGEVFADSAYETWLGALAAHRTRWRAARTGAHWTIDGVSFRVLHPPTPWPRQGEDLNEDSVVLEVSFGGFRALFMGDAGFVAESALAGTIGRASVLKVGHHGSRTASSEAFLAEVHPQAAVISLGRNNYGHPSPETLARLASSGASVWRTDIEGTLEVRTDGNRFTVKGARSSATFVTGH